MPEKRLGLHKTERLFLYVPRGGGRRLREGGAEPYSFLKKERRDGRGVRLQPLRKTQGKRKEKPPEGGKGTRDAYTSRDMEIRT